jgi:hypothetical protein
LDAGEGGCQWQILLRMTVREELPMIDGLSTMLFADERSAR